MFVFVHAVPSVATRVQDVHTAEDLATKTFSLVTKWTVPTTFS